MLAKPNALKVCANRSRGRTAEDVRERGTWRLAAL